MKTTTYSINLTDGDSAPAWMSLCTTATPGAQDSGRVRYTVTTEQPEALEAALDADDSVIEYETQDPEIVLEISVGTPSDYYSADEQQANGALDYDVTMTIGDRVIEGGITLYRDRINGGMSPCGSPLDGWVSSEILRALEDVSDGLRRDTIRSLAALSDGPVR